MNRNDRFPRYKYDLFIRLGIALPAAYIASQYGGSEGFLKLIGTGVFYIEYGSTLLITLIVIHMIFLATRLLDIHFDWYRRPLLRVLLQVLFGIVVPDLVAFILAASYFAYYDRNIFDYEYHLQNLQFNTALIALFNVYYLVRYLLIDRARLKQSTGSLPVPVTHVPSKGRIDTHNLIVAGDMATLSRGNGSTAKTTTEEKPTETFIARSLTRSFPIPLADIAYFYKSGNAVYVRLFSSQEYLLSLSLDTIEGQLGGRKDFFRVSRQMIVSYGSVLHFEDSTHGKLSLSLSPSFDEMTVSRLKAQSFKTWLQRGRQ